MSIVIITNKDYIFTVKAELKEIDTEGVHIIEEPIGRNTAPAIALGIDYCKDVLGSLNSELLFVTPSDALIRQEESFRKLVSEAENVASKGYIVTLGITPTKPETGYGYIHAEGKAAGAGFKVESFKEKPDLETAEKYLKDGHYFWNGGMFLFPIQTMQEEFQAYCPEISELAGDGYEKLLGKFSTMPDISIDYAVAEKSQKMAVFPMKDIYWNDVGSFDAIDEVMKSKDGNTIYGDTVTKDCKNVMILGSNRLIAGIGLEDLMIVDTPDVLLVAKKGHSQDVKKVVEQLKKENRKEVSENVTMYRPWGSYTILAEGPGYKVKRIEVKPGGKLSLQMHYHRSEHWTVISGTGKCTLDDKSFIFRENESTFIPIGVKHRLENPGKLPLAIIEVQDGKYLGEDDIVRFDDVYGRNK